MGGYGGALYITDNSFDVNIADCTFSYNSGLLGGSIAIDNAVTSMIIDAVDVSNSFAYIVGGGIYVGSMNSNLIIRHTDITNCSASSAGGGVYIGYYNDDISFDDVVVTDCSVALDDISSVGGGIFVDQYNGRLFMNEVIVTGCNAYSGGGIVLNDGNSNAIFRGLQIVMCEATGGSGGGLSIVVNCDNLVIEYSGFFYNLAVFYGGGIALGYAAGDDMIIRDSVFDTCIAGIGGGIVFAADMKNILLQRLTISNSIAFISGGGGIAIGQRIVNFVLERSLIQDCSSIGVGKVGGGVVIDSSNLYLTFKEVTFARNYAVEGAALYAISDNSYMSLAGCIFENNIAVHSGGAFVGLIMNGLLVIDLEGFDSKVSLESEHPYMIPDDRVPTLAEPKYIIQNKSIHVHGAIEFVVLFDLQTMLGGSEAVNIYSSDDKLTLLHRYVQSFPSYMPGIDIPPIYVPGPSFYVEFVSEYIYETGDNYGILMHAYPVLENPSKPCLFSGNMATNYGGAVRLVADVQTPVMINAKYVGNVAGLSGGAIFFRSTITAISLVRLSFLNNVAHIDGGGVMVLSVNEGMTIRDCTFETNSALGRGGGISIHLKNGNNDGLLTIGHDILLQNCTLRGNTAGSKGGGMYIGERNDVMLNDCSFMDNSAIEEGGGLHMDVRNTVVVTNCKFLSNFALENGGGISSSEGNSFSTLTSLVMRDNRARLMGGAMSVYDSSDVSFQGEIIFESNSAQTGGAISFQSSLLWLLGEKSMIDMTGNIARRGSAIALAYCPTSSRKLGNISFAQNVASIGGTVYWVHDVIMATEPAGLSSSTLLWQNNTAGYGIQCATQATAISGPQTYSATVYDLALDPPLTYALSDYYNQKVENDTEDLLLITLFRSNCGDERGFLSGADTLATGVKLHHGSATFSDLKAYCNPLGNLTIEVTAQMILFGSTSHSVSVLTRILLRECEVGEELISGMCVECPTGSFSVILGGPCVECISLDGIKYCKGKEIELMKGYWRRYETSSEVLACIEEEGCAGGTSVGDRSCASGYEGPLCAVCQIGYYSSHGQCKECSPVTVFKGLTLLVYLFAFGVFLFVIILAIYFRNKEVVGKILVSRKGNTVNTNEAGVDELIEDTTCNGDQKKDNVSIPLVHSPCSRLDDDKVAMKFCENDDSNALLPDMTQDEDPSDKPSLSRNVSAPASQISNDPSKIESKVGYVSVLELSWLWLKMNYLSLTAKLKITIATYQVVNGTSSTLAVILPVNFTSFMSALDFMNIDLGSALPWKCVNDVDYIDFMVVMTLLPIGISFLIFFTYTIEFRFLHFRSLPKDSVGNKYLLAFLWLTYLVLPYVTTTIFAMFICTNIDPDDEDNDLSDTYLNVDMQISCDSDHYKFGVLYACFMIILYPLGVLLFYMYMLYSCKDDIKYRNKNLAENSAPKSHSKSSAVFPTTEFILSELAVDSAVEGKVSPRSGRLAFLWAAYKPEYWYFEIVETSRRMILTALLSVISPGTSGQIVVAVVVSSFYVGLYDKLSPYAERFDNTTASIGMVQILITFFAALVVSESLLPNYYELVVDVVLIVANVAVALVSLYFTVKECQQDIGAFSELEDIIPTSLDDVGNGDGEQILHHVNQQQLHDDANAQVARRMSTATRRASSAAMNLSSTTDFYKAIKQHQNSKVFVSPTKH